MYHVKFKSKVSYLGEKISILPWQMAEQLAVEVDVRNMTYTAAAAVHRTSPSIELDFWTNHICDIFIVIYIVSIVS